MIVIIKEYAPTSIMDVPRPYLSRPKPKMNIPVAHRILMIHGFIKFILKNEAINHSIEKVAMVCPAPEYMASLRPSKPFQYPMAITSAIIPISFDIYANIFMLLLILVITLTVKQKKSRTFFNYF